MIEYEVGYTLAEDINTDGSPAYLHIDPDNSVRRRVGKEKVDGLLGYSLPKGTVLVRVKWRTPQFESWEKWKEEAENAKAVPPKTEPRDN